MRNYYRVNTPPPPGIDKKSAHIVGGGIAGLAAAVLRAYPRENRLLLCKQAAACH